MYDILCQWHKIQVVIRKTNDKYNHPTKQFHIDLFDAMQYQNIYSPRMIPLDVQYYFIAIYR